MLRVLRFFLASCLILSLSCTQINEVPKQLYKTKKIADIEFAKAGEKSLKLDLYLPENASEKVPLIVWIHGGGWRGGSKKNTEGLWLVKHGFAIASISYRLSHEAKWPAQIDDCRAAVRYLRSNADKYGFDGNKIAVWGESAGGLLAGYLGTKSVPKGENVSSEVQAVINWYGPSDLMTLPENIVSEKRTDKMVANSNASRLFGKDIRDAVDLANSISPLWNVSKNNPPFLIMQGDQDPYVVPDQSVRLHKKQKEVGAPSELYMIKGAGHGGKLFHTEEANSVILTFLNKVLVDN